MVRIKAITFWGLRPKSAATCLKMLIVGLQTWRPGFYFRSGHMGYQVNGVVLGRYFSEYVSFPFQFSLHQQLCLSIYGSTAIVDLGRFFNFLIYTQSVGLLGRGISPSQGHYLHTVQHKHRISSQRHPCLEWDSKPTSSVFERAKTVHALDRAVTVIGTTCCTFINPNISQFYIVSVLTRH
jgi:hypothetical protein